MMKKAKGQRKSPGNAKGGKEKRSSKLSPQDAEASAGTKESAGAKAVIKELEILGLAITREQKFDDCCDDRCLPFDFGFIADGRTGLIEYDGSQHFTPSTRYHKTPEAFEREQNHDRIKTAYAHTKKIPLLRLAYDLNEAQIHDQVRSFVLGVRKEYHGIIFAANNPALYNYLHPAQKKDCVIL